MSIAIGIQGLRELVDRIQDGGHAVAADLARQMRGLADSASEAAFADLQPLCRAIAETVNQVLGDEQLEQSCALIEKHTRELLAYAEQLDQAHARGEVATCQRPAEIRIVSGVDEQQYAETVGMFVGNALSALQDLEEDLLSIESAGERLDEAVASIRRTVHTLKAEFGVLNMLGPQKLCHQAETTIDAIVENGMPFPVDTMLAVGDLIKQFVERLAQDVKAEFGGAESMLKTLLELSDQAGTHVEDETPLEFDVSGDFADSLPEFVGEARSHLADAEVAMVELSRDPEDGENLNLTFRAFHTIKGVAGFLNLTAIVELAHVAETLLDAARSGHFTFEPEDIDLVLAAGDMITQMIAALEGESPPTVGQWKSLISRIKTRCETAAAAIAATKQGVASPAGNEEAAATANAIAEPKASAAQDASAPAAAATAAAASESAPNQGGVVATPAPPTSQPQEPAANKAATLRPQPPAPAKKKVEVKAARVERTIKVSTVRLDMLVDMVGELVIAQSMVLQDPAIQQLDSQTLGRNIGQVGKITRDLQEAAMSLRMVTVKSTFQKMARLVRDVAGKSRKRVALELAGEDTELDRNVVEQIADPLVHMIRNAVDHGIEPPADRAAVGKDQEGQLSLSAYHQGGSIVIEIRDDGRGLDREKLFEKAKSKGLVAADAHSKSMSDNEIFGMIFMPGFSTAEKVTDLSGRGVGMDVVRRNIEALRGKIEIESTLGKGTTFRLRLPLTLAIIDGMIVRVGQSRYVVPTLSIEQSFRPSRDDVHYVVDRGECVHVRGTVLPIYRLKQVFDQGDGLDELGDGILIVVEVDGQRSCLFVDEILGQQQVVIKSLGMSRDRVVGLSGGAIMTDGRVALIVDVGTLVDSILTA